MEIDRLKQLNTEKQRMMERQDFNMEWAFKTIDTYGLKAILREDIRAFMNRNGVEANALDTDRVMMRMDLDCDGRLTYQEFCSFFDPTLSPPTVPSSPLKSSSSNYLTPLKT